MDTSPVVDYHRTLNTTTKGVQTMPHVPIGPALRRALIRTAGADPFDQAALHRLWTRTEAAGTAGQRGVLSKPTMDVLNRAKALDDRGPSLTEGERVEA